MHNLSWLLALSLSAFAIVSADRPRSDNAEHASQSFITKRDSRYPYDRYPDTSRYGNTYGTDIGSTAYGGGESRLSGHDHSYSSRMHNYGSGSSSGIGMSSNYGSEGGNSNQRSGYGSSSRYSTYGR